MVSAKNALDQAKADHELANGQLAVANQDMTHAQKDVDIKQQAVDLATTQLKDAKTAQTEARKDYVSTVRDVAAQYEEKYRIAVDRLNDSGAGDKAQLKANVATARNEMKMAFAKEARLLSDCGLPQSAQKDLIAAARTRVDTTMDRVTQRTDFKSAERRMSMLMGVNNINQAIGGVLQSTANNLSMMQNAEAIRTGAEKTREEEMLDQTKDLFQQEQKLIDQVVQLFTAVIQAENQSMRDAIQA